MKLRLRFYPRSIYGQMVMLVSLSMFITLSITSFLLFLFRPDIPPLPHGPWTNALAIETGIQALQAAPPENRARIAKNISNADIMFVIGQPFLCREFPPNPITNSMKRILVLRLNLYERDIETKNCAPDTRGNPFTYISLPRDNISVRVYDHPPLHFHHIMRLTMPLTISLLSLLAIILPLTFWSIWHISRPLRNIAASADAFGYDISPAPIPIQGPTEVRRLTHAFNRMQARIAASVDERTRMLMAIGHDLRTPLTRLFMRLELGGEEASPEAMHHDLTLMKKMLNGALYFLKEQTEAERAENADLSSLLESLCLEYSAVGQNVTYTGPSHLTCICQATALERAVSNLIENGLKYGTHVDVHLHEEKNHAVIDVKDNGPGIPDTLQPSALLPFYRLDPARASDGGLGLGLSIADAIIARHHGHLSLSNIQPRGFQARIVLPLRLDHL